MVTKLIMACILSATLLSCNGQNTNTINYATVEPLHINRFDKDLFRLIDTGDTTLQPELIKQYPEMLDRERHIKPANHRDSRLLRENAELLLGAYLERLVS